MIQIHTWNFRVWKSTPTMLCHKITQSLNSYEARFSPGASDTLEGISEFHTDGSCGLRQLPWQYQLKPDSKL